MEYDLSQQILPGYQRVSEKSKVVSRLLRMVDDLNAVNCINTDPGTNVCIHLLSQNTLRKVPTPFQICSPFPNLQGGSCDYIC